ncbi:MAG: two pore domain potassium channel family protein [Proteobacteria bacterium]|nr:two pore domain potassium channel family protein [Pseudomonadota bacterium]
MPPPLSEDKPMFTQLLLGTFMIGATVVFHAFAFDFIIKKVRWLEDSVLRNIRRIWKALLLAIVVLAVFVALVIEMWAWCGLFYGLGAFPDLEQSLYYSIATFTTAGYGDVIPTDNWRLLGSIASANGFLLFGWSTAFIFEITATIYRREAKKIET